VRLGQECIASMSCVQLKLMRNENCRTRTIDEPSDSDQILHSNVHTFFLSLSRSLPLSRAVGGGGKVQVSAPDLSPKTDGLHGASGSSSYHASTRASKSRNTGIKKPKQGVLKSQQLAPTANVPDYIRQRA